MGADTFMVSRRELTISVVATCCLTTVLLSIVWIGWAAEWDPWMDVNEDGIVNVLDLYDLAQKYGTNGTALEKAGLLYDSGWISISNMQGQNITVNHGLGIEDWNDETIIAEVTGKTTEDGSLLRYLGLTTEDLAWNRTYGGGGGYSVIESAGGYALLGTNLTSGETDFWLVKTDSAGNVLWNRTYGGYYPDDPSCVVQTEYDDGFALVGLTYNTDEHDADFWLVKTSKYGIEQWNQTYGGEDGEGAASVLAMPDGFLIAGSTDSYGAGSSDIWLVKTYLNGTMQWNKTYGGTDIDDATCVIATSDGGYAIAGNTQSYGSGWYDFWLVKIDYKGKVQWSRTYGGTSSDLAASVIETIDGGYALAGRTASFDIGGTDFWLVKTDAAGIHQWNRTYGGTGYDRATSIMQTSEGGYVLVGTTDSFGAGGSDFWLVQADASGLMQCSRTYGGTDSEDATCAVATSDGYYALVGSSWSYGSGMWLVKTKPNAECGLVWIDSSLNTVVLYRGTSDPYWNYLRVRILKKKY
jgi:predicted secreted protein